MVYEIMELLLNPEEKRQQVYESFFFYWNKYPKISKIAMLCFLRSYQGQLEKQLSEIYERYGDTNFCIKKLSSKDLLTIENLFIDIFIKNGGNDVI